LELLREILRLRLELQVLDEAPPALASDLAALLPPDFLQVTPYARLAHFPRYLKAMKLRAERARKNPVKDAERQAQMAPYLAACRRLPPGKSAETFRWLVEEFRVSLFAQELGTAEPVSAVKLDRVLAALRVDPPGAAAKPLPPVSKPIVAASVGAKKLAPLKDLGSLDRLLGR
jgi:ATP-dependent helicase HrpA